METLHRRPGPGRRCVLPRDPGRYREVHYLGEVVELAAFTADAGGAGRYLLAADTYTTAAGALSLPAAVFDGAAGAVVLWDLSAGRLQALRSVLAAFRRAVSGDPEARDLLVLLAHLGADVCLPAKAPHDIVADLERLVAVLTLDTPAVREVVRGETGDRLVREVRDDVEAAWRAVGSGH